MGQGAGTTEAGSNKDFKPKIDTMSIISVAAICVFILVKICLIVYIWGLKKKHQKEIVNVIDDSLTARKYLKEAEHEILKYRRTHDIDNAMIERLLRTLETEKEYREKLLLLIRRYRELSVYAYEQFRKPFGFMLPMEHQLLRQTLQQLYNLETKPDGGKPTKSATGN